MKPFCACTKCVGGRRESLAARYVRLVSRWRRLSPARKESQLMKKPVRPQPISLTVSTACLTIAVSNLERWVNR